MVVRLLARKSDAITRGKSKLRAAPLATVLVGAARCGHASARGIVGATITEAAARAVAVGRATARASLEWRSGPAIAMGNTGAIRVSGASRKTASARVAQSWDVIVTARGVFSELVLRVALKLKEAS